MILVLKLKNSEGKFIALGYKKLKIIRDQTYYEATFKDSITEYDWEENSTQETAIYILRDSLYYIGTSNVFDIGCDESCYKFIARNVIKEYKSIDCGIISFNENIEFNDSTILIEKAIGWEYEN